MRRRNDPIEDYLEGHKERGCDYDEVLAMCPFDSYMTAWETRHVRELLGKVFPDGVERYLDFACGTGRMTEVIAPNARLIVGIDVSSSMLEVARGKLPSGQFIEADLTSDAVDIGRFDLVSSFRFFGNAEPRLRESVLRALNSRVRDGGYLLVNSHRNPWAMLSLWDRLGGGDMDVDLTFPRFRKILHAAGFRITEVRPIAVWHFRHAIAAKAGANPRREALLERAFSAGAWAVFAPDVVILAKKVRSVP